jgi:hypothetical protein
MAFCEALRVAMFSPRAAISASVCAAYVVQSAGSSPRMRRENSAANSGKAA